MTLGARIDARRAELGLSQAELARRVGVRQSTMNSLIKGDSRTSRSILAIARELRTTPAFLIGETEDPDAGAPPPPPPSRYQFVTLQVALPSETALARMFEGLLEAVDRSVPVDELARELAQLLPTALSQLKGPLVEGPEPQAPEPAAAAAALATADRGSPR